MHTLALLALSAVAACIPAFVYQLPPAVVFIQPAPVYQPPGVYYQPPVIYQPVQVYRPVTVFRPTTTVVVVERPRLFPLFRR